MGATGRLIERQIRRSDLDRQLLERCQRDEKAGRTSRPVITISREMGSGGKTIGRMVANELGFAFYDKEIINEIAEAADSSPAHIGHIESGERGALEGMMLNLLDRRHVTDTVYLRSLIKTLRKLAEQGRVVIIGRGGACVLRQAFKVRIIAPFDVRVQRMGDLERVGPKEAEQNVLSYDHQQKRFLRCYFGCAADDQLLYDLVINTQAMALEHAAELIITGARQVWGDEVACLGS